MQERTAADASEQGAAPKAVVGKSGMYPLSKRGLSDAVIAGLSALAILAALFLNFLRYHDYPLLKPEVGIIAAALAVAALFFALLYKTQKRAGRAVLEALLIVFAVYVNTAQPAFLVGTALIVLAVVLVTRRSVLPFAGTMALVAMVAATFGLGQAREPLIVRTEAPVSATTPAAAANAPAIVHIILDEHIGIEGLDSSDPRAAALARDLSASYLSNGFRVLGGAYSRHFHSVNSIPRILNFGTDQAPDLEAREHDLRAVRQNAYFDALRNRGYRIHVHQSDYLDFCRNQAVASCTTHSLQSFRLMADSPIPPLDRAWLMAKKFAPESLMKFVRRYYRPLRNKGVPLPDLDLHAEGGAVSINALDAFDRFIGRLQAARPGEVYFAHMLLPHFPYARTPDCQLRAPGDWKRRELRAYAQADAAGRKAIEAAYFDQVRCASAKIRAAQKAVSASPAGDNYVMIVHGDHGSRLAAVQPSIASENKLSAGDFAAGFSILFAVHAPDLAPGYDERTQSADNLLPTLLRSNFRTVSAAQADAHPWVLLPDKAAVKSKRHMLPPHWLDQ